ncbi:hypothetical protein Tco_0665416 [Tanacetum coccineum]
MLAYMLSPSGLICCGGGSDGESGLDLLRDEGGKSDESSGYRHYGSVIANKRKWWKTTREQLSQQQNRRQEAANVVYVATPG